tara:strand:+ start:679 stop:873 length:195 start_codon:yes stop_codon:yes gene_type:complete
MVEKRITTKQILALLEKHEAECAIRMANIESKFESGSKRFARIEMQIIGIYGLIIAMDILNRVI